MLEERLPVHVDPIRMAETGRQLRGRIRLQEFERLSTLLASSDGDVTVALEFGVDVEGIRFVKGAITGEVSVVCQRCLEAMTLPVDIALSLAVVRNDSEAEQLPSYYDPLLFIDEPIFLRDVIEDELILALPVAPHHAEGECAPAAEQELARRDQENTVDTERKENNPFAALTELKTKH